MRRFLVGAALVSVLCGISFGQSLGDVARANRAIAKKKAAHVYTNEDFPSVNAAPPAKPEDDANNTAKEEEAAKSDAKPSKGDGDKAAADSNAKANDAAAAAIAQQKEKVSLLARELDVLQREYKLQTVTYYADAGTRLRDPKDWTDQRKKFDDDITAKTNALADAKATLETMQEDARKSGAPPSSAD